MRGLTLGDPALLGAAAGFSPLSLSPALWLDASDAATITSSAGKVSQWNDKSGNSRHVVQATSANQPTTGSNIQNGRNVISFNGSQVLKKTASGITSDLTVVSVFKVASATTFVMPAISLSSTLNARPIDRWHSATQNLVWIVSANTTSGTNLRTWSTFAAWSCTYSTSSGVTPRLLEYKNNAQVTTFSNAVAHNSTSQVLCIGQRDDATTTLNGDVAEVLVFPSILTSTERSDVQNYLAAKWAL